MLTAMALAAATAAAPQPVEGRYVADYVPAKALALDPAKICKEGFVDPDLLAVHLMFQLEMFEGLRTKSADKSPPGDGQKGACAAAIVIQRMALNIYAGYLPTRWHALNSETAPLTDDDLEPDVADNSIAVSTRAREPVVNAAAVVAFTHRFIASAAERDKDGLSATMIECDFTRKVERADPAAPEDRKARKNEFPTFERSGLIADGSEGAMRIAGALKVLQFRQYAGNLVYRGAADSFDGQHATYATGRDLYATDAGFSFTKGKDLGDEGSEDYSRTRKESLVGAIGIPVCGLRRLEGKDCAWKPLTEQEKADGVYRTAYTYDFIPYVALDRAFKKTKSLYKSDPEKKTKSGDTTEYGFVAYLASNDDRWAECKLWTAIGFGRRLTNCGAYTVVRAYHLENELDGSQLDALSLRHTPLIKTSTPGLDSRDICLNAICGDPDRWLRTGVLIDARFNQGWFEDTDMSPFGPVLRTDVVRDLNRDYARVGYRAGVLGVVKILPDLPLNFWAAYTDLYNLKGYKGDLGEVQTQVSVTLGAATIALDWRNGRREDTAKRDSTYALKVGFKTK
jgi:hypothetical protein